MERVTWQVVSSNGVLQVNMKGYVTEVDVYEDGDPSIRSIKRFDMQEFYEWSGHPITPGDSIDILCIGYWYEKPGYITSRGKQMWNERYEPAVEDYRNEVKGKIVMG